MCITRKQLDWPSRNFGKKMHTNQYTYSSVCICAELHVCCASCVNYTRIVIFFRRCTQLRPLYARARNATHTKKKFLRMIMQFYVLLTIWYLCVFVLIYIALKLISVLIRYISPNELFQSSRKWMYYAKNYKSIWLFCKPIFVNI